MSVIRTNSLTKYYGKHRGVHSVSLEINEGDKYGFVGPNGAGKSTFIRLLLGMLLPSSGDIWLFDQHVKTSNVEARKKIGYIPAEVNYYDAMTSKELLLYSAGFYTGVEQEKMFELAEYFELNLDKRIEELSTGNKKKTAIIQSLLHSPELLIMDEPTSGLDPLIKNKFFDLLEEENEKGLTIFFSSHILSEIQRLCTKTAVIREGEIVAVENVYELLQKQVKRCQIIFKEDQPQTDLPKGFQNASWSGNKLVVEFYGDVNMLMDWVSQQKLLDITVEEPDLETVFLNYYKR